MLQLDNFRIPGKNLLVSGNLELRTEDIAGETSGTDAVEKGIKPKVLRVGIYIPFKTPQDMTDLIKTAEALDENGARKIYTITNRTANAAGIRQVRFFEHLNWTESEYMQLWEVSFTLQEYLSNPERAENREPDLVSANTAKPLTEYQVLLNQAETNLPS
ncbi:MAG: hypothetical protein K9L23_13025 [Desulfotignum sp.]|nr:hypothetical protein [Desulfotignum sp.]